MGHHHHNHSHHSKNDSSHKLLMATFLNFAITAVEIAGGIMSNSIALLSDALHNFGDGIAVFLAYLANKISTRKPTKEKTFGFKRVEILAALINSSLLFAICVFLFYEAYRRLINPEPIDGALMMVVAFIGLIANVVAMSLMKKDAGQNINIKAAYLHLMGDTLSSVAVLVGGVLIYFFHIYWIDPVITFIVGIYIMKETWLILKQAYLILLQATPQGLDLSLVKQRLELVNEIENVHHIHAWNLDDRQIHFECHVDLKHDYKISETEKIIDQVKTVLKDEFSIAHTTIQFEYNCCNDKSMIY
jgi:cobalt-zinc-cadmium efflux system protein